MPGTLQLMITVKAQFERLSPRITCSGPFWSCRMLHPRRGTCWRRDEAGAPRKWQRMPCLRFLLPWNMWLRARQARNSRLHAFHLSHGSIPLVTAQRRGWSRVLSPQASAQDARGRCHTISSHISFVNYFTVKNHNSSTKCKRSRPPSKIRLSKRQVCPQVSGSKGIHTNLHYRFSPCSVREERIIDVRKHAETHDS
jgi:hypothetical protein